MLARDAGELHLVDNNKQCKLISILQTNKHFGIYILFGVCAYGSFPGSKKKQISIYITKGACTFVCAYIYPCRTNEIEYNRFITKYLKNWHCLDAKWPVQALSLMCCINIKHFTCKVLVKLNNMFEQVLNVINKELFKLICQINIKRSKYGSAKTWDTRWLASLWKIEIVSLPSIFCEK